jgi:hypothetical protein
MKWRQPWHNTLRRQAPFNPFARKQLVAGLRWSAFMLAARLLSVFAQSKPLSEATESLWVVPCVGFALSLLISLCHWLSPLSISSGPRGIVRSKGEHHALIPWSAIREHRFYPEGNEVVLELSVTYSSEPERLYVPLAVNTEQVGHEINRMSHNAA